MGAGGMGGMYSQYHQLAQWAQYSQLLALGQAAAGQAAGKFGKGGKFGNQPKGLGGKGKNPGKNNMKGQFNMGGKGTGNNLNNLAQMLQAQKTAQALMTLQAQAAAASQVMSSPIQQASVMSSAQHQVLQAMTNPSMGAMHQPNAYTGQVLPQQQQELLMYQKAAEVYAGRTGLLMRSMRVGGLLMPEGGGGLV